jgi:uncharacterized membrane protein YgcG
VICFGSFALQGQEMSQQSTPVASDVKPDAPAKKTYTVPAGTKVLLQLRSALNTKSAQTGDGVYLVSAFPVVVGNRVMIPAGVYVQGVVDRVQRAGRVKGKAELDMHFSSIIFPNGSVVEIPGVVSGLPGASKQTVKKNDEGTITQDSDKARNAGKVAEVAIPTGGTIGSRCWRPLWHCCRRGYSWDCDALYARSRCEYSERHSGRDGLATTADSGRGQSGWSGRSGSTCGDGSSGLAGQANGKTCSSEAVMSTRKPRMRVIY